MTASQLAVMMLTRCEPRVTLDPDVEQLLRDAMQRRRQSFKEALNQAVRNGLSDLAGVKSEKLFRVHAQPMGLRPGIDTARLNQLADELEAESFVEVTKALLDRTRKRPRKQE